MPPITPYHCWMRLLDGLMWPIMWSINLLAGVPYAATYRTHFWNNQKLKAYTDVRNIHDNWTVANTGAHGASARGRVRFHLHFLKRSWKKYIVLMPMCETVEWQVGWLTNDVSGVSLIPIKGPARVLIGDGDVIHFGLNFSTKNHLAIKQIGSGQIGDGSTFERLPLF